MPRVSMWLNSARKRVDACRSGLLPLARGNRLISTDRVANRHVRESGASASRPRAMNPAAPADGCDCVLTRGCFVRPMWAHGIYIARDWLPRLAMSCEVLKPPLRGNSMLFPWHIARLETTVRAAGLARWLLPTSPAGSRSSCTHTQTMLIAGRHPAVHSASQVDECAE